GSRGAARRRCCRGHSYCGQMPPVERAEKTSTRPGWECQSLFRRYRESRYAPDAIVKIEACRLRLAQKELWIASFYMRQGKYEAALPRFDAVITTYGRTQAAPQALYQKAAAPIPRGRTDDATAPPQPLV